MLESRTHVRITHVAPDFRGSREEVLRQVTPGPVRQKSGTLPVAGAVAGADRRGRAAETRRGGGCRQRSLDYRYRDGRGGICGQPVAGRAAVQVGQAETVDVAVVRAAVGLVCWAARQAGGLAPPAAHAPTRHETRRKMKDFAYATFSPEAIEAMTVALEGSVATLPEPVSSHLIHRLAESILRAAQEGELDPIILQRMALLELQIGPGG